MKSSRHHLQRKLSNSLRFVQYDVNGIHYFYFNIYETVSSVS